MKNRYKVIGAAGIAGMTVVNQQLFQGSMIGKIIITLVCVVLIGYILTDKIKREKERK